MAVRPNPLSSQSQAPFNLRCSPTPVPLRFANQALLYPSIYGGEAVVALPIVPDVCSARQGTMFHRDTCGLLDFERPFGGVQQALERMRS